MYGGGDDDNDGGDDDDGGNDDGCDGVFVIDVLAIEAMFWKASFMLSTMFFPSLSFDVGVVATSAAGTLL